MSHVMSILLLVCFGHVYFYYYANHALTIVPVLSMRDPRSISLINHPFLYFYFHLTGYLVKIIFSDSGHLLGIL